MKIVDRISLNFRKFRLFKGIKGKNGGVFQIFFEIAIKINAEQNTMQGLWLGKGNIVSQHPYGKEKKQRK